MFSRRIVSVVGALVMAVALTFNPAAAEPAEARHTQAHHLMIFLNKQLGKPYRLGTHGLRRYDCSGLVYRAFHFKRGMGDKIGNRRARANWYFNYFRNRGMLSTTRARVGDLVFYGRDRVTHVGIYVGTDARGRPLAISALLSGVRKHRVHAVTVPFRAYGNVNMSR